MELEESTRGGQNKAMLEWGLQRLPYPGRPGWAETERMPTSSPQLCHVAAGQASRERVSAALCAPAAAKLTRSQDSSDALRTREHLLLRKKSFSSPFPSLPLPWPSYCSAMGLFKVLGDVVSSREVQQGGTKQGALQLAVSGDGILTSPRLVTAWGLAGAKGLWLELYPTI